MLPLGMFPLCLHMAYARTCARACMHLLINVHSACIKCLCLAIADSTLDFILSAVYEFFTSDIQFLQSIQDETALSLGVE